MYQYMRDDRTDDYQILELQDKILEIMVYVDELCKENNIKYCLMGGSALGAKRHGGFIPWDDDLDIFMRPDQYEQFRKVFRECGDQERYYLQEWGLTEGMITIAKVRMNGTTYIEESLKKLHMHHGIYIDIFILHTCPNLMLQQLWQCLWGKYVITKGLALRQQNRHKGIKGIAIKTVSIFPEHFLVKTGLKQVYRYRDQITDYYCNFLGKAMFRNAIYKQSFFSEVEYVPFEKVQLCVPKMLHEFLEERFGDYMKIPSPEQIKWEQHAEIWNVKKDFREYLPDIKDYSDESKLI